MDYLECMFKFIQSQIENTLDMKCVSTL